MEIETMGGEPHMSLFVSFDSDLLGEGDAESDGEEGREERWDAGG